MIDLGKYAATVLGAYGVSLALIGGLIALTVWRGARIRRALAQLEVRMGQRDD